MKSRCIPQKYHVEPVPSFDTLPHLAGQRLGAAGIPTTRIQGVAATFGERGVMYVVRAPKGAALKVPPWGMAVENEWVILNQIPKDYLVGRIVLGKVPSLVVDPRGTPTLVLGR